MSIHWIPLAERIAEQLRAIRPPKDQSVRLTMEQILEMSGETEEPAYLRQRSTWAAAQRGDRDWDAHRRAGLVLNFYPDRTGEPVQEVVFRLDRFATRG